MLANMLWQHLAALPAGDAAPQEAFHVDLQPLRMALATQAGAMPDTGRQFFAMGQQAVADTGDGGAVMAMPRGTSGYLTGISLSGSVAVGSGGMRADLRGFAILGGLDFRVAPGLTLGGALAVSQAAAATRTAPGISQADRIQGAAYGRYDFGEGWISEGFASWGRESLSMRRTVPVGTASFALASHASGDGAALGAYLGKALDVGSDALALTLVPSLGLQYLGAGIDPFLETGGAPAMSFSSFSAARTQGRLGLDGAMTLHVLDMTVSPTAHVAWVDDFGGSNGTVNTAFAAAPGTSMRFALAPHDRSYAELGLGANIDLGKMMGAPATLSARYDASAGRQDIAYKTWTGRLIVHF
jgi:outer membrane autotransporter protein